MSLKALIFTSDRSLATAFAAAVAELPFDWTLVEDLYLARQFVQRDRFDLLLIDLTAERRADVVREARKSEPNHGCVIFAISPRALDESLRQLGADVYLKKPSDLEGLSDYIREQLPLMKHERRWSRRCPVSINIVLRHKSQRFPAKVLTISEGGMRVQLKRHVERYNVLTFAIALAGDKKLLLYGKIVWRGGESDAGIRFLGLTEEQKRSLSDWVQSQPIGAD